MSSPDIQQLFSNQLALIPVYENLEQWILGLPGTRVVYRKTQASFYARRTFASAWPPVLPAKNRPDTYFVVSFYLDFQVVHPRIVSAVEPHPGQWTHHVLITSAADLDETLLAWLREAYEGARQEKV
ncbi:MAG: hypothetical protein EOM08_00925 [Clostridia bacterium]|nr:hypothetical protein [Clostridia bacterium]NCC74977.1 hypothetical protein [Clostridia bacterium]